MALLAALHFAWPSFVSRGSSCPKLEKERVTRISIQNYYDNLDEKSRNEINSFNADKVQFYADLSNKERASSERYAIQNGKIDARYQEASAKSLGSIMTSSMKLGKTVYDKYK